VDFHDMACRKLAERNGARQAGNDADDSAEKVPLTRPHRSGCVTHIGNAPKTCSTPEDNGPASGRSSIIRQACLAAHAMSTKDKSGQGFIEFFSARPSSPPGLLAAVDPSRDPLRK
jgi:hypothetical protein